MSEKESADDMRLDDCVLCRVYQKASVASTSRKAEAAEEDDNNSVNPYPPGYRFVPSDEELILGYLHKKIHGHILPIHIHQICLTRTNPNSLTEKHPRIGEGDWYFFTWRNRKYPNGKRPDRGAEGGFWKPTDGEKIVKVGDEIIGYRNTSVFYEGKPKNAKKTRWTMHEYRIKESPSVKSNPDANAVRLDDCVLCRIYKSAARPTASRRRRSSPNPNDNAVELQHQYCYNNEDQDPNINTSSFGESLAQDLLQDSLFFSMEDLGLVDADQEMIVNPQPQAFGFNESTASTPTFGFDQSPQSSSTWSRCSRCWCPAKSTSVSCSMCTWCSNNNATNISFTDLLLNHIDNKEDEERKL